MHLKVQPGLMMRPGMMTPAAAVGTIMLTVSAGAFTAAPFCPVRLSLPPFLFLKRKRSLGHDVFYEPLSQQGQAWGHGMMCMRASTVCIGLFALPCLANWMADSEFGTVPTLQHQLRCW